MMPVRLHAADLGPRRSSSPTAWTGAGILHGEVAVEQAVGVGDERGRGRRRRAPGGRTRDWFTGTAALAAWDPEARPVPVAAPLAARSALQDGAAALLIDLAGPIRFVVEGDDLQGLGRGLDPGPGGDRRGLDSA